MSTNEFLLGVFSCGNLPKIRNYFSSLAMLILWAGLTNNAVAESVIVTCTNYNDPKTCTITPKTENDADAAKTVAGYINTVDSIDYCTENFAPDAVTGEYNCVVNNIPVICIDSTPGEAINKKYACRWEDQTTANCDIDKTADTKAGSCDIVTGKDQQLKFINDNGAAKTNPQKSIAEVIATVCTRHNVSNKMQQDCNTLLGLNPGNPAGLAAALGALTPDAASAPVNASQTSLRAQSLNIGLRMAQLRREAKEDEKTAGLRIKANGTLLSKENLYPEAYLAQELVHGGAAAADAVTLQFGRLGSFFNGTLNVGDKTTTGNEQGFDYSGSDVTGGVDYRYTDEIFFGLAFGFANNATTVATQRGNLDLIGFNLIAYGGWYPNQKSFIDANLIVGGNNYTQERQIKYTSTQGAVAQTAKADYFANQFSLSINSGYEWVLGGLTLSPFGQLQLTNSAVEAYRERMSNPNAPGAGWALTIDEQSVQSTTLSLGGQFTYAWNVTWGVLIPQTRIAFINEFNDDINIVQGNFISDPNATKFSLPTDPLDSNYVDFGIGSTAIFPGGQTAYFFYNTQLGYKNINRSSFNIGARWEF